MTLRLGPHVIRTTEAARQWTATAPIVKGCGNVGILQSAPPNAIRVFRWVFANQNLDDAVGTVNIIVDMLAGYRHPQLFVEIWNEAHPTLAQLSLATALLHTHGLKVAGGSYGTGDYGQADFDIVRGAGCDALSLHAYWGDVGFSIWHALRYRQYDHHGLPILITECGRDKVEGGKGGWHADGLSDGDYTRELVDYAIETSKDADVIGVTPFSAGATFDWQTFETDSISSKLIAALGGNVPTPPSSYNVGAGVLALMKTHGDAPRSDEVYKNDSHGTCGSETIGDKGLYYWIKATGVVHFVPFG